MDVINDMSSKLFKGNSSVTFDSCLSGINDFEAIDLLSKYLNNERSFVTNNIGIVNSSRSLKLHDRTINGINHKHTSGNIIVTGISACQVHSNAVKTGLNSEFLAGTSEDDFFSSIANRLK